MGEAGTNIGATSQVSSTADASDAAFAGKGKKERGREYMRSSQVSADSTLYIFAEAWLQDMH